MFDRHTTNVLCVIFTLSLKKAVANKLLSGINIITAALKWF